MRISRVAVVMLAAICLVCPRRASAGFNELRTDRLRLIYYGDQQAYLVPYIARCFENSWDFHRRLFDYSTSERTTIVLHDLTDHGNAGAFTAPWNGIWLAAAPPDYAFETMPANERINATLNHEAVHIVAKDRASRSDRLFRTLFHGKIRESADQPLSILYSYLTAPRRLAPRWYHEGIAVFLETWMAGGLGRAQSSYDEMVFRTVVRDSSRFYDMVGLESEGTEVGFEGGMQSYLYGTRFMSYLALQYGPETLLRWVTRSDGTEAYYTARFERVYGMTLDEAWSAWVTWEQRFQQYNLAAIRRYPTTGYRTLSPTGLGSVSKAAYDAGDRMLYVAVSYPGTVAYIAGIDIDRGSVKHLCDIKGPTPNSVASLAYDSSSHTLFYTSDNDAWRDLVALDVRSGRSRTLIKDARIGDLAFNCADKSLWGVRHVLGRSVLVRIPPPYDRWEPLLTWPYGRNIYGIDLSLDGQYLSAGLSCVDGSHSLILARTSSLRAGDTTHAQLFDFGNSIPTNFAWSADARYLTGSSYYSGVSNIFRWNFGQGIMEAVSNCETGLFNPVLTGSDSLIAFAYTGEGFLPVMLVDTVVDNVSAITLLGQQVIEKHPELTGWMAGSPARIGLDTMVTRHEPYSGLKSVRLAGAYPIVEGYRAWPAYGARVELRDPLAMHCIDITASYTPNSRLPDDERWHLGVDYAQTLWSAAFRYNGADFYDLFGPTKSSRKGHSLGARYHRPLLDDGSRQVRCSFGATGYWGLQKLPEYQNITISYDRFLSLTGAFDYYDLRSSLGAVEFEKGYRWRLAGSSQIVRRKVFTRVHTGLDLGMPLPWRHASLWLRAAGGFSPNQRREPLANFYFGGFGNNWIDRGTIKRFVSYYSFPGIGINEVGGTTFARVLLEWDLPPLRFRRLGLPMLYATWVRTSLFSSALVTNPDDHTVRQELWNLGVQADLRLMLMSRLPMTFSVGYAAADGVDRSRSSEWMVSLKVL